MRPDTTDNRIRDKEYSLSTTDVIVIGAGHNGLVAAFYLARAGYAVQVLEARDIIGGACTTRELVPGYKFSTCANQVHCWRPKIVAEMRLLERGLTVGGREVDTAILPANAPFTWWPATEETQREIRRFSHADAEAWPRWLAFWEKAGSTFEPYLLGYPPSMADLRQRAHDLDTEEILSTILTTSLAELADRTFESAMMRDAIGTPLDIGSLYDKGTGLLKALEVANDGDDRGSGHVPRGYVRGGMGQITQAMAEAVREHGGTIRSGAPVRHILVEDGHARGVELDSGERIGARVVVSNADVKRTFLRLIPDGAVSMALIEKIRQLRTDIAPLKFHCALSEAPEFHAFPDSDLPIRGILSIGSGREYRERSWDDARHGRLPKAPHMALHTPSAWDDSLAPPGHHTVSIWILFAPARLAEGTWPERREEMAERLISMLDTYSPNFRRALVDHVLLTPWDLEEQVLLTNGSIHHVDIIPGQMLWQRPLTELSRYRAPIQGLYLCGAGQHPYGEVSGGPGHNAAHAVLEDLGAIEPGSWEQRRLH